MLHRVAGSLRFCSKEHARLHARRSETAAGETETGAEPPPAGSQPTEAHARAGRAGTNAEPAAGESQDSGGLDGDDAVREAAPASPPAGQPARELPPESPAGPVAALPAEEPPATESASPEEPETAPPAEEPAAPAPAGLLPLTMPAGLRGGDAALRAMPHRAPRRRIIVPTHRPAPALRELRRAGPLMKPSRPMAPVPAARQPVLRPLSPALRTGVPFSPWVKRAGEDPADTASGVPSLEPRPVERLVRIGGLPLVPMDRGRESRPQPVTREGLPAAPQMSFPRRRSHGPALSIAPRRSGLPQLTPGGAKPALSGLLSGGIQPFRLHRPPARTFRLPPGLAVRPGKAAVGPLGVRSAAFDLLFVPRVTAVPLRPSYAFGPPPAGGGPSAARFGLTSAPTDPARPLASLTGE